MQQEIMKTQMRKLLTMYYAGVIRAKEVEVVFVPKKKEGEENE
mgnify:CR=1 FL=1